MHKSSSWTLVWCHELCYKMESLGQRGALAQAVAQADGRLICLRKAKQLVDWVERAPRGPYTVVIDWRETKPCVRALQRRGHGSWPAAMVVTCDQAAQAPRARAWVKELGPPGLESPIIHVRPSLGNLTSLARELRASALGQPGGTAGSGSASPTWSTASCHSEDLESPGEEAPWQEEPMWVHLPGQDWSGVDLSGLSPASRSSWLSTSPRGAVAATVAVKLFTEPHLVAPASYVQSR